MSSLDDELAPLRIKLEDIRTATNNFAEKNLLKRGENANVYKGVLLSGSKVGTNVAIRKYTSTPTFDFYIEIKRISLFKYKKFVSLIGFCDEEDERMIVMEHIANGSLHNYLSDPITLTCFKRLQICIGAVDAASWHKIKKIEWRFKILLDKDWEAKLLVDFSKKHTTVYSLGLILLGVLYGRKATISDVNQFVAKMAKNKHEEGEQVDDTIDPNLRRQISPRSLSIFSKTTYVCLKDRHYSYRTMSDIGERLKEALDSQWKHENPLQVDSFASMKIPLTEIKLATNNFDIKFRSVSSPYMFKAELGNFGSESVSTIEGENNGELPKKKVIIKRDYYPGNIKDFFAEMEMLRSCKHPNILTLLGFCDENSQTILVFECDFQETLHDCLSSESNRNSLTWEKRIRIGLGIAQGLKYLHNMKQARVIQSERVFLDENWTAKIANFRFSDYGSNEPCSSEDMYILSLGVTLFDILTRGKMVGNNFYIEEGANEFLSMSRHFEDGGPKNVGKRDRFVHRYRAEEYTNEFLSMAQRYFEDGEPKNIADPWIMEETQNCNYTLKKGPNEYSLDTFVKIAYQCLVDTPSERPTLEVVIKSLEEALQFQVKNLDPLEIALEDIVLATNNFENKYFIGEGGYGKVYKCLLPIKMRSTYKHRERPVAIKRISRTDGLAKQGFFAEVDVLCRCKHPNIITFLGFCDKEDEMLLVFEYASNGSLDDNLGNDSKSSNLTWSQRLKMCIDIAHGLEYLHTTTEDKERIIHRDIKSGNILLGENWEAKIADFGLSKLVHSGNQQTSTIITKTIAGTDMYLDPEYKRTGSLKKASDIYSFGVVLFEIFSGKLAYDETFMVESDKGLAPIAQRRYEEGTLKEILDSKVMDEASELGLTLNARPDHDSLDSFSKIAYECVARTQKERPTIEVVIKHLKEALQFQENRMKILKVSLEQIKSGVENFSDKKCIMKGKLQDNNIDKEVVVKRFTGQEDAFLKEFEILFKYKHENIIGLVGCCKEMEEKIIVYEHVSKGSLNSYLNDPSLTWTERLKICIDIAKGLKFLHEDDVGQDVVIHRDINSSNVLLTGDWKAKICGFEFAITYPKNKKIEYVVNDVVGSLGYCDPSYWETHFLTKESDIYSLGVILFEILCGRSACSVNGEGPDPFIDDLVKRNFEVGRVDEIVFNDIKEQIVHKSFVTFRRIAFQCLHVEREERPTAGDVVVQLQKALEFQEDYEIKNSKLQNLYENILDRFSNSTTWRKDIYNILSDEILKDHKLMTSITEETILDLDSPV